ncbi:MAG: PorT family protein [Spirochaetes bacterium]|nr:PorT family protein [Spirochaetota bacterium]
MKKILVIMMCLLLPTGVFAMDIRVGGAIGLSHSWPGGSDWSNIKKEQDLSSKLGLGFEIGAFVNIPINEHFSIQPELNILFLRMKHDTMFAEDDPFLGWLNIELEETIKVTIFEIPVLAKVNLAAGPGSFSVFAGPALQIILGDVEFEQKASYSFLGIRFSDTFSIKSSPDSRVLFAGIFGAGYAMPMGPGNLSFDLRYRRTFTDMFDNFNLKINNISIRAGYSIGL